MPGRDAEGCWSPGETGPTCSAATRAATPCSGDPGTDQLFGLGGRDDLSDTGVGDELWGGGGADVLTSLSGDPTWLRGGAGDDVIDALDTFVDHLVDGGPGHDRAWYDDEDPVTSIEERLLR